MPNVTFNRIFVPEKKVAPFKLNHINQYANPKDHIVGIFIRTCYILIKQVKINYPQGNFIIWSISPNVCTNKWDKAENKHICELP